MKVFIQIQENTIALRLNVFSAKKMHRIKLKFKTLREELTLE